jgi:ketosteroid isomerase-like protein
VSQENVEIVRRSLDHINATGEFLWDVIDREVEWVIDPIGLLAGTYRGHAGVETFWARVKEGFDDVHFEVDDLIGAGDCVVALGRTRMHGRGSGVTAEQPIGWAFRVRDSCIVWCQVYFTPAEALKAVGLEE